MSTTYPQFPATTFPDVVQELITYTDLTSSDYTNYNSYRQAIEDNNYALAKQILAEIETGGVHKAITAGEINKLIDTVNAIQYYMTNAGWTSMVSTTQATWMAIINQFSYIGTWSASTAYKKWNMVTYTSTRSGEDGGTYLYIATCDVTGGDDPYTDYAGEQEAWYRLTIKGAQGISGTTGTFKGAWSGSASYIVNDIVTYNGVWWAAKRTNINVTPVEGDDWTLFLEPKLRQYPVQSTQPTSQETGDLWFEVI